MSVFARKFCPSDLKHELPIGHMLVSQDMPQKACVGPYFLALAEPAVMQWQLWRDSFCTPRQIVFGNTVLLCMSGRSRCLLRLGNHIYKTASMLIMTLFQADQSMFINTTREATG